MDKTEEMIGSYGPQKEPYEKKFMMEEAPSGLLARGHYEAKVICLALLYLQWIRLLVSLMAL